MWKKIHFNKQNIKASTGSGTLIKLPNKSKYNGYQFWHPSKLVRCEGGNGYFMSFSYTDDFYFKVSKGTREKVLTAPEMEIIFQNMDNEIGDINAHSEEAYLKVKEPKKVEKGVEINEGLLNSTSK